MIAQQRVKWNVLNRYLTTNATYTDDVTVNVDDVTTNNDDVISDHGRQSNVDVNVGMLYDLDVSLIFSRRRSCSEYVALQPDNFRLTSKCSVYVHGHLVNPRHVKLWVNVTRDGGEVSKHVSLCKGFYLTANCSLVTLSPRNVTISQTGQLLYHVSPGVSLKYDLEQYVPSSSGFAVCAYVPEPPHEHGVPWLIVIFFIAFSMLFLYFFIKTLLE